MPTADVIISRLCRTCCGVFSIADATAAGASRASIQRRERRGTIKRVHRGIYFAGQVVTPEARRWAAIRAAGSDALLGGLAALDAYGLLRRPAPAVEIVVQRRQRPLRGVRIRRSPTLHPEDQAQWKGMPITTVERALVDAADRRSAQELCRLLREAAFRNLLDIGRLERTIARAHTRKGIGRLRQALSLYSNGHGGTESALEARFARMLERAGVPGYACNVTIESFGTTMRIDGYIEHLGLVVEIDPEHHERPPVAREDALRSALCQAAGLQCMRVHGCGAAMKDAVRAIATLHREWITAGRPLQKPLREGTRVISTPQ